MKLERILKAAAIIIREQKLLVVRAQGKELYVSPGGKIEGTETAEQALIRELLEELQITVTLEQVEFFGTFSALAAYDPSVTLVMQTFIVNKFSGPIIPGSEIEEVKWITSEDIGKLPLGSIFEHEVIPKLKSQGLIL
ncbi:MAG TPA: NUDIX domain-containing protein [Patescibacteria group bacterium]|nr:NUDIX domain-containing protein [Patescibacteria group bacterium]